jgi:hypothetical protein
MNLECCLVNREEKSQLAVESDVLDGMAGTRAPSSCLALCFPRLGLRPLRLLLPLLSRYHQLPAVPYTPLAPVAVKDAVQPARAPRRPDGDHQNCPGRMVREWVGTACRCQTRASRGFASIYNDCGMVTPCRTAFRVLATRLSQKFKWCNMSDAKRA